MLLVRGGSHSEHVWLRNAGLVEILEREEARLAVELESKMGKSAVVDVGQLDLEYLPQMGGEVENGIRRK